MKRRGFLGLLGGAAAAIALPYEPSKLYFFGGFPGATPGGITLTTVTSTLSEYGSWTKIADPLQQEAIAYWQAKFIETIERGPVLTFAELEADQLAFYNRRLLERLEPQLPFDQLRLSLADGPPPAPGQEAAWRKFAGLSMAGPMPEPGESITYVSDGRQWVPQ